MAKPSASNSSDLPIASKNFSLLEFIFKVHIYKIPKRAEDLIKQFSSSCTWRHWSDISWIMLPLTLQTVLNDTWSKNLKMCSTWIKSLSVLNELGFRMIFGQGIASIKLQHFDNIYGWWCHYFCLWPSCNTDMSPIYICTSMITVQ